MSLKMPFHAIRAMVGQDLGFSDWLTVDQRRINQFAEATDDFNAVHLDPAVAAESGLDTTIAHGLLTMSLLTRLASSVVPIPAEMTGGFYYGFDKVRLVRPVPCGAAVRGHFHLLEYFEKKPGQWMRVVAAKIEIQGEEKPALTCETRAVHFVPAQVVAAAALT